MAHKIKVLCGKCGGHFYKDQPNAAELSGLAPPAPDMVAALRARTERPAQQVALVTPPAPPSETSIEALRDGDTVPSPTLADQTASLVAYRASLNNKNGRS